MKNDVTPILSGNQSHICEKPDCFFCYENIRRSMHACIIAVHIRHNAWQKWEDDYLIKNFKRLSYSSMHVRLHRGPSALAQRAKLLQLGIKPKIKHSA